MFHRARAQSYNPETVIHSKWYATGDGVTDDTAALNAFFANATAGLPCHIDDGTYKITSALTTIDGNYMSITGDGSGAVIKYTNAASTAPSPIMKIGSGSGARAGLRLSGFTIESATALTGGYALHIDSYSEVKLDIWLGNEYSEGFKLYNGLYLDTCSLVDLNASRILATNECLTWSGTAVELNGGTSFVKNAATSAASTGKVGIRIAGGCGGFNGQNMVAIFCGIGLLVDTSITGTANNQIFLNNFRADRCRDTGVKLNDAISSSKMFRLDNAVLASTGAGDNLWIAAWANGQVDLTSGSLHNSTTSDGLMIDDATAVIDVSPACRISSNTGYGINASTAVTVKGDANFLLNTAGNYNSTYVYPVSSQEGRQAVADAAATMARTDTQIAYTTLTASRIVTLPAASTMTPGRRVVIVDESGSASSTVTISVAPNGTDTIDGSNTTQVLINEARGRCELECDGAGKWALLSCSVVYTNALGADVALNNTSNYFTGPTVAQGTVGRWRVNAHTTIIDTGGAATCYAKLWDGTSTIAATAIFPNAANLYMALSLAGEITSPAGNITLSARDLSRTTGAMLYNQTGTSADSKLTARRLPS